MLYFVSSKRSLLHVHLFSQLCDWQNSKMQKAKENEIAREKDVGVQPRPRQVLDRHKREQNAQFFDWQKGQVHRARERCANHMHASHNHCDTERNSPRRHEIEIAFQQSHVHHCTAKSRGGIQIDTAKRRRGRIKRAAFVCISRRLQVLLSIPRRASPNGIVSESKPISIEIFARSLPHFAKKYNVVINWIKRCCFGRQTINNRFVVAFCLERAKQTIPDNQRATIIFIDTI